MTEPLAPSAVTELLRDAREYRSAITVRAHRLEEPRSWTTARGSSLDAAAGDWLLSDDGGDEWTVTDTVFRETYAVVDGDRYRKTATVRAVQVDRPFAVRTLEGVADGEPADWLVQNPSGDTWPVPDTVFRARYRLA